MYAATGEEPAPLEVDGDCVVLYRPVGLHELALIEASGFREFPPRLPQQPIFYPVTNEEYATQIAREWNTRDSGASGNRGFVTRFRVRKEFLSSCEVHQVGGRIHQELWIPAEDLLAFNGAIVGQIQVISEFGADSPSPAESGEGAGG